MNKVSNENDHKTATYSRNSKVNRTTVHTKVAQKPSRKRIGPANVLRHDCHCIHTGPDSVMVRAFASEAGGAGSNPGRVIPKTLIMVPVATLLGAQH